MRENDFLLFEKGDQIHEIRDGKTKNPPQPFPKATSEPEVKCYLT